MRDKVVNGLFAIACLGVVLSASWYGYTQYENYYLARHIPSVKVGDLMRVKEATGRPTLLMEVSSTCPHCKANEPLYGQLRNLPKIQDGQVQLVVAMIAPEQKDAQDFMVRNSLPGKLIVESNYKKFGFTFFGTPTLALLDASGKVSKVWTGEIHEEKEKEFLAALR